MRRFYGFDKCGIFIHYGTQCNFEHLPVTLLRSEHYSGQVRTVKIGDTPKLACGVSLVYII